MIMMCVGAILAAILATLFGIPYIDLMKKKMFGQYIREVAPESHAKKEGTPTTGGVFIIGAILIATIITLLLAQKLYTNAWVILISTLLFAFLGYKDDSIKIQGKKNEGLTPKQKLLLQIAIALIPSIYVFHQGATAIRFGAFDLQLGYLYPLFSVFVIVASSNAFNLTDGLDGLATSCAVPVFLSIAAVATYMARADIAIIAAVTVGALMGFLKYNKPKAQIFMGDTGSLALGGLMGSLAVVGKFELYFAIIAGLFVMEALSVIIQVWHYKRTGNRFFRMAPLHHHYELCGHGEEHIVKMFAFVSMLFAFLGYLLLTGGQLVWY